MSKAFLKQRTNDCNKPNPFYSRSSLHLWLVSDKFNLGWTNVLPFTAAIWCNILFFLISKMEILPQNPEDMLFWTQSERISRTLCEDVTYSISNRLFSASGASPTIFAKKIPKICFLDTIGAHFTTIDSSWRMFTWKMEMTLIASAIGFFDLWSITYGGSVKPSILLL